MPTARQRPGQRLAGHPDRGHTTGGLHLYFRAVGRQLASSSGGRGPLGPGIDIRGPGRRSDGYLIGPGSIIASQPYTLLNNTTVRDLPTWLAALLSHPR